jgi:hypothetical protein
MYRKLLPIVAVVAMLAIAAPLAQAITFGQPDGSQHPNVGAMIVLEPDGKLYLYCSGTLIAPKVFLTAAHCTAAAAAYGAAPHDVWVTFDPVWEAGKSRLYRGTYHLNPDYGHDASDPHDVAVITLDKAIKRIDPAELPTAGLLTRMDKAHELKDQQFVAVGYGTFRDDKTGGPHALDGYGERYYAEQAFEALKPSWLQLSMNPSTGSGGTCYGDSGGPHFLGDSEIVASLTVTGDAWCRATDVTYRLDTASARAYLSQFVTLP